MSYIGNTSTTQSFTPAVDFFSGNGSTTAFTLSRPVASVAQVQVTIDNVAQNPSSAFTVSANTLTFTSAPLSGTNNIYVYYTSPITQVIAPSQGTVQTAQLGNITNIASGNSSLTLQTGSSPTTAITIDTSQRAAFVAGTAALPAITTAGDTNTGIFFPAADTIAFSEGGAESMRIDSDGEVGIGTTSPNTKLQVSIGSNGSGVVNALRLQNVGTTAGDGAKIVFTAGASTDGAGIASTGVALDSADLRFYSGGNTERMRIDSSGNLLVKKTASSSSADNNVGAQLAATGKCIFEASGDRALILNRLSDNGIIQEFFRGAGNQVGNIQANTSTVAYNTSSDYRLKEDIAPMTGALAKVTQLKPVTYKWKSDGEEGQGFIAHELQAIVPDCVTGDKDAVDADGKPVYQGIDTSFLVATLTAALQETKALLDTQAETLSQQAETIDALTARIVALENR